MPNTPLQTDGCFAAAAERHAVMFQEQPCEQT